MPSLVVAAVTLLAAWSLVPVGLWWAGASPQTYRAAWDTWTWGVLVAGLVTVLAMVLSRGRAPGLLFDLWGHIARARVKLFVAVVSGLIAVFSVVICVLVFSSNPRNVDGFAHLFQARIFLSGRLWVPPPADLASFGTLQMILGPDRWHSQYPPGQSALLAAGLGLGAWWLLNPLMAAILAWAVYRVGRWCAGESTGRLAAGLALVSPFVLAMAGSEMSHLASATLGTAAAAAASYAGRTHRWWVPGAAGGLMLGLMVAFRPLDAVAAAAPVAAMLWLAAPDRARAFAVTAVAGVAGMLPTLWYNAATTGSWRVFGYTALWGEGHSLGFHPVPWGVPLTLSRAVGLTGLDLHHLNTYVLDLPFPILAVIALGFFVGRRALTPRDGVPVLGVLALSGLLFFFWHRDVLYGPRFLFSAIPWYLILAARSLGLLKSSGRAGAVSAFAVGVALLVGTVAVTPGRFRTYRDGSPALALHPDREAKQLGLGNAVVVIPDGWGSRLIARMWGAGIPVRTSSRLYSGIDACRLEWAVSAAENSPALRSRLGVTLDSLATLQRPGKPVAMTEDANLRLDPDAPLLPACARELEFDLRYGVLAFAPFLYLNSPDLQGPIVWARDLGEGNGPLFERYAGRQFYRYGPAQPGGRPVFTVLKTGSVQ